jgi:NAD(P)-dependent dehydrogenase (short-subunit alcohol dehydrogenase family)
MSAAGSLDGKVMLVTGSTRGIGRDTAFALAHQGAALALCGRDDEQARQLATEITSTCAVQAFGRGLDVSDARAVESFARASEHELGPVSVVINNAAVLGPVGALHRSDSAAWADAISINLVGVANVVRSFWHQLASSGRGRVINLAGGGVGGPSPMQRATAYVASKAAVMALTEALAGEAVAIGVTVNAISPGPVATGFMDGVLSAGPEVAGDEMFRDAAGRVDRDISVAVGPYLTLLRYLISEDSSMINGRTLSARWEHPGHLAEIVEHGLDESRFRLRRIDAELYGALR